jgi:hypothetical protein
MAESIMSGLFGITPEAYQAQQNQQALAQSAQLAQQDPFASARTSLIYGGRLLGNAIGGALGAQDPQLQIISARNAVLREVDPNNPISLQNAIQRLSSAGDQAGALQLSDYLRKAQGDYALIQQRTAEKMTPEQRNALAYAASTGAPQGSSEFANAYQTKLNELITKSEATSKEMQNAAAIAAASFPVGSPEYKELYKNELARLTTKEDKAPSMVAEYQFAKTPDGGGFKGSYQEFVTARALASRPPAQPRAEQPPVPVVDPSTGKVILVSREEAIAKRLTPASAMESLSPKEIQNREAKYPQAKTAVTTFESNAEKLAKDLETLANSKGLEGITGLIGGRTPAITKEARAAEALYNSIVARGGFNELQNIRNSSPTGGALGNVSNAEGQNLRDAYAPLKLTQNASDLKAALLKAAQETRASAGRIKDTFDLTYEYRNQGSQSPAPSPSKTSQWADDLVNKYLNK